MPSHPYVWLPGGTPPPILPHSLAKHAVLRRYLERYIEILTSDPRIDHFSVTLVDGFAGGGIYRSPGTGEVHEGSPLILLRAMKEAEVQAQSTRTKPFRLDARFLFIEAKPDAAEYLQRTLSERGHAPATDERVRVVSGTFEENLGKILDEATARSTRRRTIFLLDQYGYSDVTMDSLRQIFRRLDNAEVILTFAVDHLLDYLNDSPKYKRMLARVGIDLDLAATRALIEHDPILGYARVQQRLHKLLFEQSGADYYTPFYIMSRGSNRAYWLLHLSKHARARDAMTELHWKMQNTFMHFGGAGLDMFGYDPREDADLTRQPGFCFDDDARALTLTALRQDIARHLHPHKEGVAFGKLFASTCNGTPGTRELMHDAVEELVRDGTLLVVGDNGRARREGVRLGDDDVVRPVPQLIMFPRRS